MSNLKEITDAMTEAFNAKDLQGFAKFLKDDFSWVNPDGSVFLDSKATFLAEVERYWSNNPDVVSKLSEPIINGHFVAQGETLTGLADGSTGRYLWIYEFDGDMLAKQWGFESK